MSETMEAYETTDMLAACMHAYNLNNTLRMHSKIGESVLMYLEFVGRKIGRKICTDDDTSWERHLEYLLPYLPDVATCLVRRYPDASLLQPIVETRPHERIWDDTIERLRRQTWAGDRDKRRCSLFINDLQEMINENRAKVPKPTQPNISLLPPLQGSDASGSDVSVSPDKPLSSSSDSQDEYLVPTPEYAMSVSVQRPY
jgi:hypothetical protein